MADRVAKASLVVAVVAAIAGIIGSAAAVIVIPGVASWVGLGDDPKPAASAGAAEPSKSQIGRLPQFTAEVDAQKHCPTDVVVWVNLPTGVYHFSGDSWYGKTKSGAYVCQKEADDAGNRATHNGQHLWKLW